MGLLINLIFKLFFLGVEFAAELSDFVRHDLEKLYPELHDKVSITLIDGYNKLLSTYDEEVCVYSFNFVV